MFTTDPKLSGISILPREIFWMVLDHLNPREVIFSRRVSRSWNKAFRDPGNLIPLLRKWFPLTREVRGLLQSNKDPLDPQHMEFKDGEFWVRLFDRLACRHHRLSCGKPMSVQKYKLCDDFGVSGEREWFPVQPWESHASHLLQRVDCPFSEAFWTYEDGVLIYPSADHHCLILMDVESERKFMVPFIITGKVVRRVRLQKMVLVVEWAEPKAFHWLNDSDGVHRHYASSFDLERDDSTGGWSVTFRNEWKIMFLGHPLSERDRFFSTHTKTHYAIYIWQPNRSLYTADDDAPIESLMAWDISKPSSYRPSLDPTGNLLVHGQDTGPSVVTRLSFRELGFFSVRQRGLPAIQCLEITDDAQAIEITENMCTGPLDRLAPPSQWTFEAQLTSIPLIGHGPFLRRRIDHCFPPYRGNGGLHSKPLSFSLNWGHQYLVISETYDQVSQVGYCVNLLLGTWPLDLYMYFDIRYPIHGYGHIIDHKDSFKIMGKGKVFGTDSHVVGENDDRELVIWRLDR